MRVGRLAASADLPGGRGQAADASRIRGTSEYTEEQKAEFRQQFSIRRKRQIILTVPLVALSLGFAALVDERSGSISILGLPLSVAGPALLAFVLGAVVFTFKNWQCPACDRYLGKGINPRFCTKCGAGLQ